MKAVDYYSYALEYVPDCYKTLKMYVKAVNIYSFALKYVSDCYNTQEMCEKVVDTFMLDGSLIAVLKKCVIRLVLKNYLC